MKHVGLLEKATGEILYHEQIEDEGKARQRHGMFALQAELDGTIEKRSFTEAAFISDVWPLAGTEEVQLDGRPHLKALEAVPERQRQSRRRGRASPAPAPAVEPESEEPAP